MTENSHLKYSATTRDGVTVNSRSRSRGPSFDSGVKSVTTPTNFSRQPMYTFSPMDKRDQMLSSQEMADVRRNLVDKSDQRGLVESHIHTPRRYTAMHSKSATMLNSEVWSEPLHGQKHNILEKLKKIGQGIEFLMQRNTTHSDDLQDRLLFLKSLMEEIFSDITDQIEDLKVENRELKRNAQDERQLMEAEAKALRRIDLLERERAELQATISQMSNAIEEGRQVQQQLLRKAQDLERLDRMVEGLEAERTSNLATIQKLKGKVDELASDKREANNRIQSQDNFLEEIKKQASSAIESNKRLDKKARDTENQLTKLEEDISQIQRKNKDLNIQINTLTQEKNRITSKSKQDLEELMRLRDINKEIESKLSESLGRLKEAARMKEDYEAQVRQLKQVVDNERRKSESFKTQLQGKLKQQRDKFGRRIGEYQRQLDSADKRLKDSQRKSDLMDQQFKALKYQIDSERKRSIAQEKSFQDRQREINEEKKVLLGRLDEERQAAKRQGAQLKDFTDKLERADGMLKDFARKSDAYEDQIKGLKGVIDTERRKSLMLQEQTARKIKTLLDQNNGLTRKLDEDQQKQQKALQAIKDYEVRFRDSERRYQDQSRKSESYNQNLNEVLGELEKERRLSVMNMREKQEVIKALEDKNAKLGNQIDKEADAFKKKQMEFFAKNQDLEKILQQNVRKSDVMAKQLLALKEQYDKERRKSLMYEENQAKLNERMKNLGEKYADVANKLEQNNDKYYKKEVLCKALEDKYNQIQRLFLEQTRKSQLNEQEIKKLYGQIDKERRSSMMREQEAGTKIKGLVDQNAGLADKLKEGKEKHNKQLEIMRQFEDRAKDFEGRYKDMARKSEVYENEIVKLREEAEKDRRKSLALDEDQKARIKALEEKNSKILQKLEQDRDRFTRTADNLKETEAKYKLIEKLLDDERRTSILNAEEVRRLGLAMEQQRRKSAMSEGENRKKLEQLARDKARIASEAEDLKERLSERSKTINSLETKASKAEKDATELVHILQQVGRENEQKEQAIKKLKEQVTERDRAFKKEKDSRQQAQRQIRSNKQSIKQYEKDLKKLTNTIDLLQKELKSKSQQLTESNNNSRYLAEVLNDMKAAEAKLNARINELYKINVDNAAMFEKNYSTLKNQIDYRNEDIEGKEKRINVLEKQVVHDSKRVIAILPNPEKKGTNGIILNPERR